MAASVFQSTTAGHAHIMVASRTGIELARMPVLLCRMIENLKSGFAEGITASGQRQRLTKSHSDKGAAIIPIDAQPLGTNGFGRAAGRYDREDFRPSSIGRTRSGLWEPPRP